MVKTKDGSLIIKEQPSPHKTIEKIRMNSARSHASEKEEEKKIEEEKQKIAKPKATL
jgi:hypothetical protein